MPSCWGGDAHPGHPVRRARRFRAEFRRLRGDPRASSRCAGHAADHRVLYRARRTRTLVRPGGGRCTPGTAESSRTVAAAADAARVRPGLRPANLSALFAVLPARRPSAVGRHRAPLQPAARQPAPRFHAHAGASARAAGDGRRRRFPRTRAGVVDRRGAWVRAAGAVRVARAGRRAAPAGKTLAARTLRRPRRVSAGARDRAGRAGLTGGSTARRNHPQRQPRGRGFHGPDHARRDRRDRQRAPSSRSATIPARSTSRPPSAAAAWCCFLPAPTRH